MKGEVMEVRDTSPGYAPQVGMPVVPEGYKQTKVGVIPEDWTTYSALEFCDSKAPICYGVVQVGPNVNSGIPIIAIKFVKEIAHAPLHQTLPSLEARYVRSRVIEGDVLISIKGTIGRVGTVPKGFSGNISRELARLRPADGFDGAYIAHQFESDGTQARITRAIVGTTRLEFSIGTLRAFSLPFPSSFSEQRAIATALSDLDALLEALDRLIAKKRDIKQAAMQQLLTAQTRLPGFEGEWDFVRLGELGMTYGGLTGKSKADFGSGPAHYVPFLSVMENVVIRHEEFERVRVESGESQNSVKQGDLLFNGSSETPEEVAMCALVNGEYPSLYLNSFCFGFRLHQGVSVHPLFLVYYLRSDQGRELMKSLAQGSTRYNLSKAALLKATISIPSFEEQASIAAVLAEMDAELETLQQRRTKTAALKQGMMQELLTGRSRLLGKNEHFTREKA